MAGREVLGAVVLSSTLVACSSTNEGALTCGPGTEARDGVCVPVVTDASLDFGMPDLGPGEASSDVAGEVADVASDAVDTASDVPAGPEPCPTPKDTEELFAAFGSTCTKSFDSGGWMMFLQCRRYGQVWKPTVTAADRLWTGAWIRTPDRPGAAPSLLQACTECSDPTTYGVTLEIDTTDNPKLDKLRVKVTVPPGPWYIVQSPGCWKSGLDPIGPQPRCRIMDRVYNGTIVSILTKDPNARAVNAFAEFVPEGTTCP